MRQFLTITLNGVSLASLYFITATGFSLIFGVMKTVNFTHGGLYLLGAYIGHDVAVATGNWYLGILVGGIGAAVMGGLFNVLFLRRVQGQLLRQGLIAFGLAIILADQMIAR
ncbi:MAG: branched-chain amino acid ABC transporter permease, partial [Spirochaetaceae bacterium]